MEYDFQYGHVYYHDLGSYEYMHGGRVHFKDFHNRVVRGTASAIEFREDFNGVVSHRSKLGISCCVTIFLFYSLSL